MSRRYEPPRVILSSADLAPDAFTLNPEGMAVVRAVLSWFLATTHDPPIPTEPPTPELREAARRLFQELDR